MIDFFALRIKNPFTSDIFSPLTVTKFLGLDIYIYTLKIRNRYFWCDLDKSNDQRSILQTT